MEALEVLWTLWVTVVLVWVFYKVHFLQGRVDSQTEAIEALTKALLQMDKELTQVEIEHDARRSGTAAPANQGLGDGS